MIYKSFTKPYGCSTQRLKPIVPVIETKTRPQTFEIETQKMGSLKAKTKSQDSITAKHVVGKPIFSVINGIYFYV